MVGVAATTLTRTKVAAIITKRNLDTCLVSVLNSKSNAIRKSSRTTVEAEEAATAAAVVVAIVAAAVVDMAISGLLEEVEEAEAAEHGEEGVVVGRITVAITTMNDARLSTKGRCGRRSTLTTIVHSRTLMARWSNTPVTVLPRWAKCRISSRMVNSNNKDLKTSDSSNWAIRSASK